MIDWFLFVFSVFFYSEPQTGCFLPNKTVMGGCFLIILVSAGKIDNLNSYKKRIYNILAITLEYSG